MPHAILPMKDKTDTFTIKKKEIFDLPCRLLLLGKTGMGKSSILGNFFLRDDFYKNDYEPENIFIFSGSLNGDMKLQTIIETLEIPSCNLHDTFDEDAGHAIYDTLVEQFNEALSKKEKPKHSVIIFDDLGFTNLQRANKKNDIMSRILCNGRKYLISTITLNQRITQVSRTAREQVSGVICGKMSNKDLELMEGDYNYLKDKNKFREMVRDNTQENHDFIVINFSNGKHIYQDKNFKNICLCDMGIPCRKK